jgi:hypothetical protein
MRRKSKEKSKEYFKKLYSNKRRLKKRVLWHERFVAQAVAVYLENPNARPKRKPRLDSDLEWLLTWKLKTRCCPRIMWCDGLENLKIRKTGKNSLAFKSEIWVGPEDGSGNTSKGTISGEIEVKHTAKQLKSYQMEISHEGSSYIAKKT